MDQPLTDARGPSPDGLVSSDQPETRVYLQMLRLKRQFRRGWLRAGVPAGLCESVADHAWGCALLCLLLARRAGLDAGHCALLALVHELGEIHAGDITPHDGISPADKRRRETAALDRLCADGRAQAPDMPLAASLADIRALWQEYEDGQSPEARFVKRIDRLEMGFQAAVYRAEEYGGMDDFMASVGSALAGSELADLAGGLGAFASADRPQG
jgi:putative hydrolase of HD superfamily